LNSTAKIISLYEDAEACARKMLLSAKAGEWEELVSLEHKYTTCVDALKAVDVNDTSDPGFLERKAELIRVILSADAEIKVLVRDWMVEIGEVLSSINADKKLKKTYEVSE
jgi:flagellar protein FliT